MNVTIAVDGLCPVRKAMLEEMMTEIEAKGDEAALDWIAVGVDTLLVRREQGRQQDTEFEQFMDGMTLVVYAWSAIQVRRKKEGN